MIYGTPLEPLYADLILEFASFMQQVGCKYLVDILKAQLIVKMRIKDGHFTTDVVRSMLQAIDKAAMSIDVNLLKRMDVPDVYLLLLSQVERLTSPLQASLVRLGLSRNDVDATVFRMVAREAVIGVLTALIAFCERVCSIAKEHTETLIVAETHHQPAQPTTLAHYLLGWYEMLSRDAERIQSAYKRVNVCPLGSAALSGPSLAIDRYYLAELLGFDEPSPSTYDAVAGADWITEMACAAAICGANLTRIIYDLVTWVATGALMLPGSLVETSSYMPQKRNPTVLEHARSLLATVIAIANNALVAVHNIPYGDHNDFGFHIVMSLYKQYTLLERALNLLKTCLESGVIISQNFIPNIPLSLITTSDLVEYLIYQKGLPFSKAQALALRLAEAWSRSKRDDHATDPALLDAMQTAGLTSTDVERILDPHEFIRRRDVVGSPAPKHVSVHLQKAYESLQEKRRWLSERRKQIDDASNRLAAEVQLVNKRLAHE